MLPFIPNPVIRYCYRLAEFFIPTLYCYTVRIPEPILLSFHSFLAHDRTVPNPLTRYCYQFNEFFYPFPLLSAWLRNSWNIIANISFVSTSDHLDWYFPVHAISNMIGQYQPTRRLFIPDLHMFICFHIPICLQGLFFDPWIRLWTCYF
jgi:hypothetical protein